MKCERTGAKLSASYPADTASTCAPATQQSGHSTARRVRGRGQENTVGRDLIAEEVGEHGVVGGEAPVLQVGVAGRAQSVARVLELGCGRLPRTEVRTPRDDSAP